MCVMCKNGGDIAAVYHQAMEVIDRVGWTVIATGDKAGAPFAYTVGLYLKRLPELHIAGRDQDVAQRMLNELARRQIQAGAFEPGQVTSAAGCVMRLDKIWNLGPLVMVRKFFGDDRPAPTALTAVIMETPPTTG
jgi:hypothetical protein